MKNAFESLTLKYYNAHAKAYVQSTLSVQPTQQLQSFIKNIPEGGYILDVGCGSGRDSAFFIQKGYQVCAVDASEQLAQEASALLGQNVLVQRVQDLQMEQLFDGVWCSASLLHLKKQELPEVLQRLGRSLKTHGAFFASFKAGEGEGLDAMERFFSYYSSQELMHLMKNSGIFTDIQIQENGDAMGRDTHWLSVYAKQALPKAKIKSSPRA